MLVLIPVPTQERLCILSLFPWDLEERVYGGSPKTGRVFEREIYVNTLISTPYGLSASKDC